MTAIRRLSIALLLLAAVPAVAQEPPSDELEAEVVRLLSRIDTPLTDAEVSRLPPRTVDVCERLVGDLETSAYVKLGCLQLLGLLPGQGGLGLLENITFDPDADGALRVTAARALARKEGGRVVSPFRDLFEANGECRRVAIEALGSCPSPEALDELGRQLTLDLDAPTRLMIRFARQEWLAGQRSRRRSETGARLQVEVTMKSAGGELVQTSVRATTTGPKEDLRVTLQPLGGMHLRDLATRDLPVSPDEPEPSATMWTLDRLSPMGNFVLVVERREGEAWLPWAEVVLTGREPTLEIR